MPSENPKCSYNIAFEWSLYTYAKNIKQNLDKFKTP